jgi:hypothetical protein
MPVPSADKSPCYVRRGSTRVHNRAKPGASFQASRWTPANTGRVHLLSEILALMLYLAAPLLAQEKGSPASSSTRSGQIQAERMEKAADVSPEKLTDGKKDFTTIKHTIIGGKVEGISPGFRMRDSAGRMYFVKSDPLSYQLPLDAAEAPANTYFAALIKSPKLPSQTVTVYIRVERDLFRVVGIGRTW